MLRAEIESKMKENGLKVMHLVYHKDDELGMFCSLQGGYLVDYLGHRVDRKLDIWGFSYYNGNSNIKAPLEEFKWQEY